jgi:hypothetical protein
VACCRSPSTSDQVLRRRSLHLDLQSFKTKRRRPPRRVLSTRGPSSGRDTAWTTRWLYYAERCGCVPYLGVFAADYEHRGRQLGWSPAGNCCLSSAVRMYASRVSCQTALPTSVALVPSMFGVDQWQVKNQKTPALQNPIFVLVVDGRKGEVPTRFSPNIIVSKVPNYARGIARLDSSLDGRRSACPTMHSTGARTWKCP